MCGKILVKYLIFNEKKQLELLNKNTIIKQMFGF